ncbi:MAG: calpain family cysteine protease, partial [archaeon]|nr:calpain family cysteine protease [archaeon]
CYFLSAVASLSNRPDYIDKLFYVKEKSANNAYGIYYCINGEWKLVVLDDYFPVIPGRLMKKLAFSCNNGNEFWVCLLEKAWAKINGNYARIGCGGLPHEVFDVLTEAWSEGLSIKKPKMSGGKSAQDDPLWQKLLRCQEKNFILTAGTGATGEAEEMGLCSGHAYSILGLYEVGKGSSRVRLIKLRNPWGYGEWVGDYSDDSVMWTAAIKKVVKPEDCQDDGEFYMTYEDFCHYYASMGICHFGINYYYATKKVSSLKSGTKPGDDDTAGGRIMDRESGIEGPAITKVDVSANNTNCYFRICQKNPRFITPTGDHYPSCVLQYIMLLDKDYNYLAAECNSNPTTCIRYPNLKAGTYYLITDTHYRKSGRECGYVISAYSDKQVGFSNVSKKTVNINEIINRAAGQLAEKIYNGEETEGEIDKTLDEQPEYDEKSPEDFEGAVTAYVTSASNKRVPFIIAHFVNHTNNKATVDLNIKKTTKKVHEIYCNDEIGEDENNFTLEIPPKGENTVLINKMAAANKPALSYEVNYSLDEDEEEEYEYEEEEEEEEEEDEEALEKVFQEKADPIDKAKKLYQYYMETDKGYVFGIENNSTTNRTISMDLTGLKVCSGDYKGRTKFNFALPAKSRRSFDTTAMSWNDELSFFFKVIK